ncbi:MAG: ATP-binding cassette domain-containing protein [Treponema sp.]|nr:ATP-binding cassette domain-containing protein [Treponema sp.]
MDKGKKQLIIIKNCHIQDANTIYLSDITWTMETGQSWLIIGPNGGGKAAFLKALAGEYECVPNVRSEHMSDEHAVPLYTSCFEHSTDIVSLERAAYLIEEEQKNDESDYIEGGVDHGRSGRKFLKEVLSPTDDDKQLDTNPHVRLCGIEHILDRGLKYMSTGEIRRTLLCRSLLSGKKLLILSDPFAGLDVQSRGILREFFSTIGGRQVSSSAECNDMPRLIVAMERYTEIPDCITHVLEFKDRDISFTGTRAEYETLLEQRKTAQAPLLAQERQRFIQEVKDLHEQTVAMQGEDGQKIDTTIPLVAMNDVTVGWDNHTVLDHLTWSLYQGQHWLIRGPNGSGKTTFLELITGDNMQVYCNDVSLFGQRRGTGESIWDIKAKLGIVSYRLHVDYRQVGGDLESVIISGFHDSIGLYEQKTDNEILAARKWLALGGFAGREQESFCSMSYGEQRALLILRAAVKCPPVLILDEPCHGLDDAYRTKILQLLETIAATGTTTLLHVTHDASEVLPCEKHILELHPNETPMYTIITE